MVEEKELAILFKRKETNEEHLDEFIPYKIVEGKFSEPDRWFVTSDDYPIPHIAEPMAAGMVYGYRFTLEEVGKDISPEFLETIKNKIFKYLNKFTYTRNRNHGCYIIITNKKNGDEAIFEDQDSDELYSSLIEAEQYENMMNDSFNTEEKNPKIITEITKTPQEIESLVRETIKGQDEAIRKIVTSIWTTYKFRNLTKKNMLVVGPTGVGKTAIFKKLEQILGVKVTIFSVPGLSQAGYVGRSTDEILKQVYYDNECITELAEQAIVILDEVDKLAFKGEDSGSVSTSGVQNELLKIIEGCKRLVEVNQMGDTIEIDTSKMLFVGIGAFSELYEKEKPRPRVGFGNEPQIETSKKSKINTESLTKYGIKREFLGRLPVVVELNPLTKEIFRDIILNSDESEFTKTIQAIESLDVKITNKDEIIELVIEDSINKGIGARGLVGTITNIFMEIFYEVANNPGKYKEVIIGKDILSNNKDFELIPRKVKRRVKTQAKG